MPKDKKNSQVTSIVVAVIIGLALLFFADKELGLGLFGPLTDSDVQGRTSSGGGSRGGGRTGSSGSSRGSGKSSSR